MGARSWLRTSSPTCRSDLSTRGPIFQMRGENLFHQLAGPLRNAHVQLGGRRLNSSASATQYSVFDSQLSAMMRLE